MLFAGKNKVFLNRMSPLWTYFLTYLQRQLISLLICGMFQAEMDGSFPQRSCAAAVFPSISFIVKLGWPD